MASIFEKEPIFSHERPWDDTTKLPEKYTFSGRAGKAEVHMDSGSLGMEFFYEKTLPDFVQAATKLDWDWYETFSQLRMCSRAATKLPGARSYETTSQTQPPLSKPKMTKPAFIEP
jgi:hypothetical protein